MPPTRAWLGKISLLALLLWGGEFLRRNLWEPDEARYAYVAREMRAGGNWFMPTRHGKPYAHKPPLMFWLMNAAGTLTRGEIGRVAARLPSLLGSLLSLAALYALGRRWTDETTARRATLILLTTYLFWKQGGWGQIDALLCGLELTALRLLYDAEDDGFVLLAMGLLLGGRPRAAAERWPLFARWVAAFFVVFTFAGAVALPAMNPIKSPEEMTALATAHLPAGGRLLIYRENGEILALYAQRPGRTVSSTRELTSALRQGIPGMVVARDRYEKEVSEGLSAFPVLARGHFPMGGKEYLWFAIAGSKSEPTP